MRLSLAIAAAALSAQPVLAAPPELKLSLSGSVETMFRPGDGCDGSDIPDTPARAFRDADGKLVVYALHYNNRPLRGASFETLKIDCRKALASPFNSNPAAYESGMWVAGTWTKDGSQVEAIVHHEYHADQYKRCAGRSGLACWYNTILAASSKDGGASFLKHDAPVVAAAPFTQETDQTRHRGFFNPSNIFSDGRYVYFFAAETGWTGQPHGVCLFRSEDPAKPRNWRAWDGRSFSIRYDDPYKPGLRQPRACQPVSPFPAQVGAVVRRRDSGVWLAVVQAWKDGNDFPVSGFYYATSRNLTDWSEPRLLMMTRSLYDDACGAGELNSYPSILDPQARGRNFDDTGASPWLYWASMRVEGCAHTSDRRLQRRRMVIELLRSGGR